MDQPPMPDLQSELAEDLAELKARSRRSYDALARRTGLSRSSLHRYCTGALVPDTFGPIESIGRACNATSAELSRLYRLWSLAKAADAQEVDAQEVDARAVEAQEQEPSIVAGEGPRRTTDDVPPLPEGRSPAVVADSPVIFASWTPALPSTTVIAPEPGVATSDVRSGSAPPATSVGPRQPAHRRVLGLVGAVIAAVVAALAAAMAGGLMTFPSRSPDTESAGRTPGRPGGVQKIQGPAWMTSPKPVPGSFFGVTINSDTGGMPTFPVGAVRLWDSSTTWSLLEPERGRYDWTILNRQLAGAERAGLPVLYTFGATPHWASPFGPRGPYPDGSRSSPPDDLKDWDDFVRTIATRYRGRISAYELWVLAPSPQFYDGSPSTLATMSRRAAQIIRDVDPAATLVCPSMGELWKPESRQFLKNFAAAGGYDNCDVAGVKLFPRDFGQPPETIFALTALIDRTLREAGVSLPLWSTGTSYRIATADKLDDTDARNFAVRLFLVALYARYDRMYFYNWGGRTIPIVLQPAGGSPTGAARAVQTLERWLVGARIYGCGHGADDALPPQVWRCRFRLPPPSASEPGREAAILWTTEGTARVRADLDTQIERLSGSKEEVAAGGDITVGEEATWAVSNPLLPPGPAR
jgi:hypothetical protein